MPDSHTTDIVRVDVRQIIEHGGLDIVTYDARVVPTTIRGCRTLLSSCRNEQETSDFEIGCFLAWCAANKYDPLFRKQAYFIRYKSGDPPSFVVNYEVFVDRAQRHPQFDGIESGVVWRVNGEKIRGKACDYPRDDKHKIVGGYAIVHRKDRKYPIDVECPYEEIVKTDRNGKPVRSWAQMNTWMMEKVPKARALRAAFPEELASQYTDIEPMVPLKTTKNAAELPPREERTATPQVVATTQINPAISAVTGKLRDMMLEVAGEIEITADILYFAAVDLAKRVADEGVDIANTDNWTDDLADKCIHELEVNGLDPHWVPGVVQGTPEVENQ